MGASRGGEKIVSFFFSFTVFNLVTDGTPRHSSSELAGTVEEGEEEEEEEE